MWDEHAADELDVGIRIRFVWPPDLLGQAGTVYEVNRERHTAAVRLDDGRIRYGYGRFFEIAETGGQG